MNARRKRDDAEASFGDEGLDGFHCYEFEPGWTILAGKTDADNERLSLKVGRPNEWWFHVRGMPGSHVVLRGPDGETADKAKVKVAAAAAAYHSKARSGGSTAVTATRCKYVGKARGAPRGTVTVRKETVLKVRPALPPGSTGEA